MTVIYIDNVNRLSLEDVQELDLNQTVEQIAETIFQLLADNGRNVPRDVQKLQIVQNGSYLPFAKENLQLSGNMTVLYSNVIALNNAREYDRVNGICYYFNSSEKPHLHYPHIHAHYSNDVICISLKDYSVEGSFKTTAKQKEAVEYVKSHRRKLLKEWHRTMDCQMLYGTKVREKSVR